MINHFLDLHTEHTPKERCSELGDALARNRKYLSPHLPPSDTTVISRTIPAP